MKKIYLTITDRCVFRLQFGTGSRDGVDKVLELDFERGKSYSFSTVDYTLMRFGDSEELHGCAVFPKLFFTAKMQTSSIACMRCKITEIDIFDEVYVCPRGVCVPLSRIVTVSHAIIFSHIHGEENTHGKYVIFRYNSDCDDRRLHNPCARTECGDRVSVKSTIAPGLCDCCERISEKKKNSRKPNTY